MKAMSSALTRLNGQFCFRHTFKMCNLRLINKLSAHKLSTFACGRWLQYVWAFLSKCRDVCIIVYLHSSVNFDLRYKLECSWGAGRIHYKIPQCETLSSSKRTSFWRSVMFIFRSIRLTWLKRAYRFKSFYTVLITLSLPKVNLTQPRKL